MPAQHRYVEIGERSAEAFHQQRTSSGVVIEQAWAALAVGEAQHGDLVTGHVGRARHEQLQHGRRAVGTDHLGRVRLGATVEGADRLEPPLVGQRCEQSGQRVDPPVRAGDPGLGAHDLGHDELESGPARRFHRRRLYGTPTGTAGRFGADIPARVPVDMPAPASYAAAMSAPAVRAVAAVAAVASLTIGVACDAGDRSAPADEPAVASTVASTSTSTTVVLTGPLHDPGRIDDDDRAAIAALGASGAGEPEHAHGHSQVPDTIATPLLTGDLAIFEHQWLTAQRSTSRFDTMAEAEELGFVRTSAPGPGVGTHWVRWPQVAEPFDPAEPSMILFDERVEPARLVAYVYWVQSADEPEGFAGPNDEWHQHTGLCIVNGWTLREEAGSAERCPGTYLAGGDLWMLHAWVVDGLENRLGDFANIHPALCPSRFGTPDVMQCPDH